MIATLRWINSIVEGVRAVASGLGTTATFSKENWTGTGGGNAITRQYPAEPAVIAPAFRGHLFNHVDRCITCNLCAKACPVDCIAIEGERTEENKLRPSVFDIDLSKCIYCGLCTRVCPTDCLVFTNDFEVDPVQGYLFRMTAEQTRRKLDSAEVERLNAIQKTAPEQRSEADRTFLAGIEDPRGTSLVAKFGVGLYTVEQAAVVNAEREKRAAAKKLADAAKAEAAKAAKPAEAKPAEAKPATSVEPGTPGNTP